jgi:hypothetical protein
MECWKIIGESGITADVDLNSSEFCTLKWREVGTESTLLGPLN